MVLSRNGMPFDIATNLLESIISKFIPIEYYDAPLIAQVKNENKSLGLSLGDSTCIALGNKLSLNIVTADKAWSDVKCESKIIFIR
jgi:PIN domain nuclease of toxin-antitoxin system